MHCSLLGGEISLGTGVIQLQKLDADCVSSVVLVPSGIFFKSPRVGEYSTPLKQIHDVKRSDAIRSSLRKSAVWPLGERVRGLPLQDAGKNAVDVH
jgi:hypothetical protein